MNNAAAEQQQYDLQTQIEDAYGNLSVGEILRRARLHYGQTLPQVSHHLRIRASQLEALELNRSEDLPGRVYAIGFIRVYSEYLGLDGDQMVYLFKHQSHQTKMPELHFPVPTSEKRRPHFYMIAGGMIGALLLLLIWSQFYAPKALKEDIPEITHTQNH